MDAICTAGFFELFLNEPYDIIERWLYEDSCSIEVWSDGSGWETVWRYGGWDNERKFKIEERVSSAPDPEYNDYNFNYFGDYHSTMWNNYTQSGGIRFLRDFLWMLGRWRPGPDGRLDHPSVCRTEHRHQIPLRSGLRELLAQRIP